MRAIPEKTLEHWVSRDVARRFPSAVLWWPSSGEDIAVDDIGSRPGKWFMLEVKTTEWEQNNGRNRLVVDLEQLDVYLYTGLPVFYVFPVPPWDNVMTAALPWLGRRRRGDLGNPLVGSQWFGHWTFVLSAGEVNRLVRRSRPNQKHATLFTSSASNRLSKVPRGARTLNQFLSLQVLCGDFRSQGGLVVPRPAYQPSGVSRLDLALSLGDLVADALQADQALAHFLPVSEDDGDAYREVTTEDLLERLGVVGHGSAQLLVVSIDANDLALF